MTPPVGTNNNGATCVTSGGITRNFVNPTCSSSDTDTVQPLADLAITKTNAVTTVNAGTATTYTVVVTNIGPSAADGAVVTDAAAAGLSLGAAATIINGLRVARHWLGLAPASRAHSLQAVD